MGGGILYSLQSCAPLRSISARAKGSKTFHLLSFQRLVDPLNRNRLFLVDREAVHSHNDGFSVIDPPLYVIGSILNLLLHKALPYRLQHSPECLDLVEVLGRLSLDLVGQAFDGVGTGEGVDRLSSSRFVGNDLLGAQRHASGLFGWKCEGLVKAIGVKRLRSSEESSKRLNRGASDVHFRLLRGERRA